MKTLYTEFMRWNLTLFLSVLMVACSSSKAAKRTITSIATAQEDKLWVKNYQLASKKCKTFRDFLKKPTPTSEIQAIANLRYTQKCNKKENVLKDLKYDWLRKDAIISGLRYASSPSLFAEYYEHYLKLNYIDRATLEFFERAKLYRKNIKKVNSKKQKKLFEKMLKMFPSFYVEYKRPVPESELFEAAYGLRMQGKFSQARRIYHQIIRESKKDLKKYKTVFSKRNELEDIYNAYKYIRVTYRVDEKKERGIKESKKAHKFFEDYFFKHPKKQYANFYTDTVVQLSRDMWTEGDLNAGRKLLLRVAKRSPKIASLDQVYWVLGRMDQENGNYAKAIEYFEKALKEDPDKDFRLKLMWLVAWNAKKNNQLEKAIDGLESLEKKSESFDEETYYFKSLFWQAMLLREQKKEEKAKDILEEVAEENTFGYYGRLAALEVTPKIFEKKFPSQIELDDNDIIEPARERTIQTLLAMDESEILSEYLSDLWKKVGKSARKKTSTRMQFLAWAHDSELYKENQQILEIFNDESKLELFAKAPSFFYPQPYLKIVEKHAKKFKVPQEMVYSIMRQESLFDRKARSPADAFGLLQLLPRVAKKHTKETGVTFTKPEELYKPEVILPLGIAHLLKLLKIFDESMLLTAASYNAGVSPVKRWLKARENDNVYEFIEEIPYLETEYYAKLVFRNLSFYVQFNEELDGKSRVELLKNYFKLTK